MMNIRVYSKPMLVLAMIFCGPITPVLVAQNPTSAPAPASQAAPVQLSVDVWDVLRLAHGNVNDATITAYIKNSGKVYALGASEILYLREQGLSDQVVTAMLDQRKSLAITGPQAAPQPVPIAPQPAPAAAPSVWANNSSPQIVTAAPQPAPNYVELAPAYAQPSPVYVYPPSYGYYDPWPYYWGYPAVSFSFGWGGRYGWGHYGGGFHGGHR